MNLRKQKTISKRLDFIKKKLNKDLYNIGVYPKDLEKAQFKNCENMIGAVQIPLGIAGPLKIAGELAKGNYYLPLATTEGALVASVSRGCKAISMGKGAFVYQEYVGITRGSVFEVSSLKQGFELQSFFKKKFQFLARISEKTSSHLRLINIHIQVLGRKVFVRFYFDTQDAMGMNMATIATSKISTYVEKTIKVKCLAVAGNFDIDKKPAWLNFLMGRGRKVWAEAVLDKKVIKNVLKTTPEKMHDVAISKCYLGSIVSGSLGFNAHFSNIIAAIFLATGQDAAHTVEGSMGICSTEIVKSGLYVSVYLPDLPVGVVGGGTNLPSQREALEILGIKRGNKGRNAGIFAQIIAGAVLAGEISLLASLGEGSLASAHQKLAR